MFETKKLNAKKIGLRYLIALSTKDLKALGKEVLIDQKLIHICENRPFRIVVTHYSNNRINLYLDVPSFLSLDTVVRQIRNDLSKFIPLVDGYYAYTLGKLEMDQINEWITNPYPPTSLK
jgi:hypothetical protein